jgi:GNAT superfamily N-acetyltransferase
MPKLEEGRVYRRAEVEQYLGEQDGTSDFIIVATLPFPRHLDTWQTDVRGWRPDEEILLQYRVYPVADFGGQLREREATFHAHEEHRRRVQAIVELLLAGSPVYPVILQENDPQRRIIEGRHRGVALWQLESPYLPAFLTGYRNWFTPDEPAPGFDKEDEIAPATLGDVSGFFWDATRQDHKGIPPPLFSPDRLWRCDVALVAKHRGTVIGTVTLAVARGKPTLSTVYVLRAYRGKGIAYRLCESALARFREAGVEAVYCDAQWAGMGAILRRLARERPDLPALVNEGTIMRPGGDTQTGPDEEAPDEGGS